MWRARHNIESCALEPLVSWSAGEHFEIVLKLENKYTWFCLTLFLGRKIREAEGLRKSAHLLFVESHRCPGETKRNLICRLSYGLSAQTIRNVTLMWLITTRVSRGDLIASWSSFHIPAPKQSFIYVNHRWRRSINPQIIWFALHNSIYVIAADNLWVQTPCTVSQWKPPVSELSQHPASSHSPPAAETQPESI